MSQTIPVTEQSHKKRIDAFLAEAGYGTRTYAQRSIERGFVLVNGKVCTKVSHRVHTGDVIVAEEMTELEKVPKVTPQESRELLEKIRIIHEDKQFLVVEKPAGLIVHPTEANEKVTLSSWITEKYPDVLGVGESEVRPGIVHRLDKDASGVLVIARTQKMFKHLKAQFKDRSIEKKYTVLVHAVISLEHGVINFIIDRGHDGKMIARPNTQMTLKNVKEDRSGKEALTEFDVLKRFVRYTLLSVRLHTGRMHQIRVHMHAYNHSVVGDTLYIHKRDVKKSDPIINRLFLHASQLCFSTLKNERVCFESPLPFELTSFLEELA